MDGVVGADQEISAALRKLVGRGEHQVAHSLPVAAVDAFHVRGQRMGVHRYFRVIVRAKKLRPFHADRPVTKSRSFGGARNDTDVQRHILYFTETESLGFPGQTGMAKPVGTSLAEQVLHLFLSDDGYSEFFCLVQLRSRILAGHHKIRLLADRT